jgi:hypothetical protein
LKDNGKLFLSVKLTIVYIWMHTLCHPKNILATSIEYSIHMDGIILFMWKIFDFHGKNILKRLNVVHKSYAHVLATHRSQARHSCSHVHTIVVLE